METGELFDFFNSNLELLGPSPDPHADLVAPLPAVDPLAVPPLAGHLPKG